MCVICGKKFNYDRYRKKCCSDDCLKKYRSILTTKQHSLDYTKIIGKIENYIIYNYNMYGIVKTLKECLIELHIAPKTYYKYCHEYNISYDEILSKNNISKKHSKFQNNITKYIKLIFDNKYQIIEEKMFKDCVNPKTNHCLKFDIFIKELNIVIECDGVQHSKKNSYFNILTLNSGYTPSYITDKIKEDYCNKRKIKLIRIPYTRTVTKEYVESFLHINNI